MIEPEIEPASVNADAVIDQAEPVADAQNSDHLEDTKTDLEQPDDNADPIN